MYDVNMKTQTCFTTGSGKFGTITLTQQGKNRFTVTYGLQVKEQLSYDHAARELGACIMHLAACEGKLNTD